MKQRKELIGRWKKGFSLAEILVAIAIISLLMVVGILNVAKSRRKAQLFSANEAAKEIFLAAQNHLAVSKASGKWDRIVAHDEENGAPLAKPMSQPSDYPEEETWDDDSEEHTFRYLTSEDLRSDDTGIPRDYENALLPYGSIDEQMRENSYIIEFDARTATVYGVWYTDTVVSDDHVWNRFDDVEDEESASYSLLNQSRKDTAKENRHTYARSGGGAMLGYYGGAVARLDEGTAESLKALAVTVENDDQLVVCILNPNRSDAKLAITGDTSGNTVEFTVSAADYDDNDLARVVLDSLVISDDPEESHFSEICPDLIPGEDLSIRVSVQGAAGKEESASLQTNSLFASIEEVESGSGAEKTALLRYARHLQNLRQAFSGVNTDATDELRITEASVQNDIRWDADGRGLKFLGIRNPYLTELNGNFYTIKNLVFQPNSGENTGLFAETPVLTGSGGEILPLEIAQLNLDTVTCYYESGSAANGYAGAFVGYVPQGASARIRDCQLLAEPDTEAGTPAAPIRIVSDNGAVGGFIGGIDPRAEKVELEGDGISVRQMEVNAKGRDSHAGGLIGYAGGKELTLRSVDVKAEEGYSVVSTVESAGGLVGKTTAGTLTVDACSFLARTLEGCSADENYPDMVSGARDAGGLIGNCSQDANGVPKVTITSSFASAYIKSGGTQWSGANSATFDQTAGGLVGYLQAATDSAVELCYFGGRTQDKAYRTETPYAASTAADYVPGRWNIVVKASTAHPHVRSMFAGGLIGRLAGPVGIRYSYSNGSVYGTNSADRIGLGGLAGYAGSEAGAYSVTTSYSAGPVYDNAGALGDGGFFGEVTGSTGTASGCYFLRGMNFNEHLYSASHGDVLGVTAVTTGDSGSIFTGSRSQDKWEDRPYDAALKDEAGHALYPYRTIDQLAEGSGLEIRNELKYHIGDWSVPQRQKKGENAADLVGEFGLLYYERVQGDSKIYFEGYTCDRKDPNAGYSLTNMEYHYVSSSGNDPSLKDTCFVSGHDKYVTEDGYLLVVKGDVANLDLMNLLVGYTGAKQFNEAAATGQYWMQDNRRVSNLFTEYHELSEEFEVEGEYKVYSYKFTPSYVYQAGQYGTVLEFGMDAGTPFAAFEFLPFFGDRVKAPDASGVHVDYMGDPDPSGKYIHRIRSAHQLNMLATLDGSVINDSYLSNIGGAGSIVLLDLDITFDPAKVQFTMCGADGTTVPADSTVYMAPNPDGSYFNVSFQSVATNAMLREGVAPDSSYYVMEHLTNPLFTGAIMGTVENLHIVNSTLPYFADSMYGTGTIRGTYITGTSFTSMIQQSIQGRIEDTHIENSTGSYLVNNIYYGGVVDGVSISGSNISDLVMLSRGVVRNINIAGSTIGDVLNDNPGELRLIRIADSTLNYLVKTINWGGIVQDYQFTNTTFNYGLCETNNGQLIENP